MLALCDLKVFCLDIKDLKFSSLKCSGWYFALVNVIGSCRSGIIFNILFNVFKL